MSSVLEYRLRQGELEHSGYMSRHATPASEFGRLRLGGSSTSSSGDMPVTTRAMRRGHASGSSGSQQSTSRTAAGPSRNTGRASRSQRGVVGGRQAAPDNDDDDSDDSEESEDSGDEDAATILRRQNQQAAFEIAAALDQQFLTPGELADANARDNVQRKLALALSSRFRTQADLTDLRNILTRAEALTRITANLRRRYHSLIESINIGIQNPGRGHDVVTAMEHFRRLAAAIGQHITVYNRAQALPDNGRALTAILFDMLTYFAANDRDAYAHAGAARPQYAGGGNQGNVFRQFVMQHMGIMEPILGLEARLLRERRAVFAQVIERVGENRPSNGDQEQFQRLWLLMRQLYQRMQAE